MTLTQKQKAQVAKAWDSEKPRLRAMYERQNALNKPQAPQQPAAKPKAKAAGKKPSNATVPRSLNYAFDGFDKRHLPLDEFTAPYTTTNLMSVMEFTSSASFDQVVVVCPRQIQDQERFAGPLTDYIAMRYKGSTTLGATMATEGVIRASVIEEPESISELIVTSVRARLHNMSVRVECLGTNTGLYPPGAIYIGSVPFLENGSRAGVHGTTLKSAWVDDSISTGYIRSISASSLLSKPCTLHSAVAENVSYKSWRDLGVPPLSASVGALPFCTSLEPILIYIPAAGSGDTAVNYRITVGQQWCTRHPHNVMLRATQKQHAATSPLTWHAAVSAVKDIGEKVLHRAGEFAVEALAARAGQAL